MNRRRVSRIGIAAVLGAALLVGACTSGAGSSPSTSPEVTAPPTPTATPAPSGSPIAEALELDVATAHHVTVVVDDQTGRLVKAASGRAGDGMSVRWGSAEVVNVDDHTLRVTWVGLPGDQQIALAIGDASGAVTLAFEQPAPPEYSDATGFDRVLVLQFAGPVPADAVTVTFSTAA
jgi:hypothetical protein